MLALPHSLLAIRYSPFAPLTITSSRDPMPLPKLKTVTRTQGNNQALKDGTVKPKTFEPEFIEVDPLIAAFRRMVRGSEFDVCEMAITTYICARAHGKPMTAIPVFLVRAFHHGAILVNTKAGIRTPKDLEGKRVGVNRGYTVTTGVWARGVLQNEHGVDLSKITWVLSGDEHVAEYRPPKNVVPIEAGKKMGDMLASGELAAAIGIEVEFTGRQAADPQRARGRARGAAARWPLSDQPHGGDQDELIAAHPDLAADVFDAFVQSKRLYSTASRAARSRSRRKWTRCTAGDGDHRRSPPLRHRAQPPRARGADRSRRDAGHHRQAGDGRRAVRALDAGAGGVIDLSGRTLRCRPRESGDPVATGPSISAHRLRLLDARFRGHDTRESGYEIMPDFIKSRRLTEEASLKMITAGVAKANALGCKVSLAVVDQSCRLIGFLMMEGARHFSIITTQRKAITAASQRLPTGYAPEENALSMTVRMGDFTNMPGGFPITVDGQVVGAVAAGGAKIEQDVEVAKAALAALGLPSG